MQIAKRSLSAAYESVSEAVNGWARVEAKYVNFLNGNSDKPAEATTDNADESNSSAVIMKSAGKLLASQVQYPSSS